MADIKKLKDKINSGQFDKLLRELYADETCLSYQRKRYADALEKYETLFGQGEVSVFSAPGRTEIGGNHTDHQRGKVLAAALNIDAIAIAGKNEEDVVQIVSGDASMITISTKDLEANVSEEGTTTALVRGILAGLKKKGYEAGGFKAYITSDVLVGSGISSSAAFEVLIGTIVSGLYHDMTIPPQELAKIGQHAENKYFGKPCGLMDQMASAVGSLIYIDFADTEEPLIQSTEFDFEQYGYVICITDTKSSHADCTAEYAAIPAEMKSVAKVFGKEVLNKVTKEELFANIAPVREKAGDRAVLRAMHFMMENERVELEVTALKNGAFNEFLMLVKASGDSSFKYLQNVYNNEDVRHQNVSLALAVSETILGAHGVCRVHGGGFAGTIQAFVPKDAVETYRKAMDNIYGVGACKVYWVRKSGGVKVF